MLIVNSDSELTISNVDPGTATTDSISISAYDANVILKDVNIDCSSNSEQAVLIDNGTNANITLQGTNTIRGGDGYSAINVHKEASLVITGESTGSLEVFGGAFGAGIGSSEADDSGKIIIDGGIVTATGGIGAAGIGGGISGSGTEIIINGGTVTATGGTGAAGIGGGIMGGGSGDITINCGIVTAIGGNGGIIEGFSFGNGSGIGSGGGMDSETVGAVGGINITPYATIYASPGQTENYGGQAIGFGGYYDEGNPGEPFVQNQSSPEYYEPENPELVTPVTPVIVEDAGEDLGCYITIKAGDVTAALRYTTFNGVVMLSSPDAATLERLLASGADTLIIDLCSVSAAEKLVIPESLVSGNINTVVAVFAERTVSVLSSELIVNGYVLENK